MALRTRPLLILLLITAALIVEGAPTGPSVTLIQNETAGPRTAAIINTTGGSITTMILNVTAQNLKWKAYVGNVTGTLVLADASGYSIFDWSLGTILGEVYATRSSGSINWSNINCSNSTYIAAEEQALNHTSNPNDNISATFSNQIHNPFYVGTTEIATNSCPSLHTFVNNQSQSTTFEEVLLSDGTNGNIVYTTLLEQNANGYNNQEYDFQMIVPEKALSSWESSTAYYFYVELT